MFMYEHAELAVLYKDTAYIEFKCKKFKYCIEPRVLQYS